MIRFSGSPIGTKVAVLAVIGALLALDDACGQEAQWVWSPEHPQDRVPLTDCFFRKRFTVSEPVSGEIAIAADDEYELYVNGRRLGSGESSAKLDRYDLSQHLTRGRNLIAVKVSNTKGTTAALAARVTVKDRSRGALSFSTDSSWSAHLNPLPLWYTPLYNDARWASAKALGRLGQTPPWDRPSGLTAAKPTPAAPPSSAAAVGSVNDRAGRSSPAPEAGPARPGAETDLDRQFVVEQVLDDSSTGSLLAMTFNEFGHVVASRENGPLLLIFDSDRDGLLDKARVYCDKVKDCQGILCLNGDVFVTGEGPEGHALYRLADRNRDGVLEDVRPLIKFRGPAGDSGAHGIALGKDGFLYVAVSGQTQLETKADEGSPHRGYYEGGLVTPGVDETRPDDGGGSAPAGTVLRVSLNGAKVQIVAGGLRNAYDLAFSREGELFVSDGDAEEELGMPWYRPAALYQVAAGGEYGWRLGLGAWPDHACDRLPETLKLGHAGPTGMVFYNHLYFPNEYRHVLFMTDWVHRRVLAVTLKRNGAGFSATSEVFLEDEKLHIADLDVGPDGALYFVTGGGGTPGGLYRVRSKTAPAAAALQLGEGITAVIRQPQLESAWSRQQIAAIRARMGVGWERELPGVAMSAANPWEYRVRALELLQLFGPTPSEELMVRLARAEDAHVRTKAAELMGLYPGSRTRETLVALLGDNDRQVRRAAGEALARAGQSAPLDKVTRLLKSDDLWERWAARRLLERVPVTEWRDAILASDEPRLLTQGCLALMIADPTPGNAKAVLERTGHLIGQFLSDRDFLDTLRVMQVAYARGHVKPDEMPRLRDLLAEEFPSADHAINRELVRLLAYLQVSSVNDRFVAQLQSPQVPDVEKLHVALYVLPIQEGWTTEQRLQVFEFLETAQRKKKVDSYARYITSAAREFAKQLSPDDVRRVLAEGTRWPNVALGVLYGLPKELHRQHLSALRTLDEQLRDFHDTATLRLKVGIIAVLARSGDSDSQAYLRNIWDQDPERRQAAAMGLAQTPTEENWDYLVRSLPFLEGPAAREVLVKLRSVNLAPEEPEYYRQVILRGLVLQEQGAKEALALLEYWTGERQGEVDADWKAALAAWQAWYHKHWPARSPAELPQPDPRSKWRLADVLRFLNGDEGRNGSPAHGAQVFERAQCAKCHAVNGVGEAVGPDLTAAGRRFTKRELLEAILYPSHTIADRYAAQTVLTHAGRIYAGSVGQRDSGEVVVTAADGQEFTLTAEVEAIYPQRASAMPNGLVDRLALQEIADLFAYFRAAVDPRLAQRIKDTNDK
jgi:putative heme-binding domain-containing protein